MINRVQQTLHQGGNSFNPNSLVICRVQSCSTRTGICFGTRGSEVQTLSPTNLLSSIQSVTLLSRFQIRLVFLVDSVQLRANRIHPRSRLRHNFPVEYGFALAETPDEQRMPL